MHACLDSRIMRCAGEVASSSADGAAKKRGAGPNSGVLSAKVCVCVKGWENGSDMDWYTWYFRCLDQAFMNLVIYHVVASFINRGWVSCNACLGT